MEVRRQGTSGRLPARCPASRWSLSPQAVSRRPGCGSSITNTREERPMAILGKSVHRVLWAALIAASAVHAETPGSIQTGINSQRIILLDIQRVGSQLFSAGERG